MHILHGRRIALHSLGCKLNQAELQELAVAFEQNGLQVVAPRDEADAHFINTCTVTAEAERKARQWLRMARRAHPGSLIVACGCAVERSRAAFESLADLVISNEEKSRAVELTVAKLSERHGGAPAHEHGLRSGRTRSLVKIQEGCATPCAYCIVPYVRRGERSVPVAEVLSTITSRIRDGHREVVLTGTRIGAYRDNGVGLVELIPLVLALPGVERLRVSSLQPQELSPALLDLWRDARLCRHFHLSLQSGSPAVLERMRRRYRPQAFALALADIRASVPGAAVTTDVIVGFPGESEQEFDESVTLCEELRFARIHVFPFSRRPGTPAARMPGQVPGPVIRQRMAVMEQLAERSRAAYAASWLGRSVQVLWEEEVECGSGVYAGTSDNYLRLLCRSELPLHNVVEDVVLERCDADGVWVRR